MKKFALVFVSLLTVQAFATKPGQTPPASASHSIPRAVLQLPVLCQLDTDYSERLFESSFIDVLKVQSLHPDLLKMVLEYVSGFYQEVQLNWSLAQLKALLKKEYSYDELSITIYKHRPTGKEYAYPHSYPGDNEFGIYYDAKTKQIVGRNEDSSIYLESQHGSISCYDLTKNL